MLSIYLAYLKTSIAVMFQYRASMLIWMIWRVIEPIIYLVVWTTVAKSRGDEVGGYTPGTFAAYYIVVMIVQQYTFTWIMHEYEWRVRSGTLSAVLLKPIHPIHSDIADNIGYKVLMTVIIFPAALFIGLLFAPVFTFHADLFILFLLAVVLSYVMRFFIEWALALVAFWTTRNEAFNQVYFLLGLFLTGRIAPLGLLPDWLREVGDALPFQWMLAFPIELLLGRLTNGEIAHGLTMLVLYLVFGFGLHHIVWWRGVRKYSAVGA